MRVKLDENLPATAKAAVAALGHDVETVADQGLGGSDDEAVTTAARRERRFLITLDRGMGDVRRYPPGSHPGILVIRVADQQTTVVLDALGAFFAHHNLDEFAGCTVVVRGHLVRVRRPPP